MKSSNKILSHLTAFLLGGSVVFLTVSYKVGVDATKLTESIKSLKEKNDNEKKELETKLKNKDIKINSLKASIRHSREDVGKLREEFKYLFLNTLKHNNRVYVKSLTPAFDYMDNIPKDKAIYVKEFNKNIKRCNNKENPYFSDNCDKPNEAVLAITNGSREDLPSPINSTRINLSKQP